jgi:hypothetical protein
MTRVAGKGPGVPDAQSLVLDPLSTLVRAHFAVWKVAEGREWTVLATGAGGANSPALEVRGMNHERKTGQNFVTLISKEKLPLQISEIITGLSSIQRTVSRESHFRLFLFRVDRDVAGIRSLHLLFEDGNDANVTEIIVEHIISLMLGNQADTITE